MPGFPRAELRAGRNEPGVLAPFDGPKRFEIEPGLPPAPDFRGRHGKAVARVVVLGSEIDDDIAGNRQARRDAPVLGQRFCLRAQACDRLRNPLGRHGHGGWNAAEPCAEGAEVHMLVIAVAGARAAERRQVAVSRAVHKGLGGERRKARMAGYGDGAHPAVAPHRIRNEAAEHNRYACCCGQLVEDELHGFRLEDDEHAPMAERPGDRAALAASRAAPLRRCRGRRGAASLQGCRGRNRWTHCASSPPRRGSRTAR